jgi:putative ABC transport system permease protein
VRSSAKDATMNDWTDELRSRLADLRLAPAREASILAELAQHLDERLEEIVAGGISREAAIAIVRQELDRADRLGPRLSQLRQSQWTPPPVPGEPRRWMPSGVWSDLRYTWRALLRDPLVAAIAIATLALGIGLNTAMFSFMNGLILRPLPFPDADRLVRVYRGTPQNPQGGFSAADYAALRDEAERFGQVAAYQPSNLRLDDDGRDAGWLHVSSNLFDVLGVQPTIGRSFTAEDDGPGARRVALISRGLWQNRFGGAADIVGRTLHAGGQEYEIVGVLPLAASDHRLFGQIGVFSPLPADQPHPDRRAYTITVLARLARAAGADQGRAMIEAIGARRIAGADTPAAGITWRSEPLPHTTTGPTGRALIALLLGLSGFVLLIACSNLANLLLARAIDRSREFAVRAALGASRLQISRTVAMESALLALAGGVGALAVAHWTTTWLQSAITDGGGPTLPMDWRVLAFAGAAAAATVVLCGIAPASFGRRLAPGEALKSGGRGSTAGRGHVRMRNVLLAGQFALAMTLVAGATTFVRASGQLVSQHYGWNATNVVQMEIAVPEDAYPDNADILALHSRVLDRLSRVPGASAVSVSYGLPYMGLRGLGRYTASAGDPAPVTARINGVSRSYFDVTGTPLVAGRLFAETDTLGAPPVVILGESMARRLFPGRSPLGHQVLDANGDTPRVYEVIGVVGDVRPIDIAQEPAPYQLYMPTTQDPRRGWMVAVRAAGNARAIVPDLRSAMTELDPNIAVRRLMTADERMREVTGAMGMMSTLLTGFAGLGLLLAALGIYGAMARMVAQRTTEIGVRVALGAQIRDVIALLGASAGRIVAAGLVTGALGTFVVTRALRAALPAMEIHLGLAAGVAIGCLTAAAVAACYLPARQAVRVDPVAALRAD